MPFALAIIRKLADAGHTVFAADDSGRSPGSHSKYVERHFVTASPRGDTLGFVADVERICSENEVDVVVPAFEEAFYLATQAERLAKVTKLFAPEFATIARLHDKQTFQALCEQLGLPVPKTIVATTPDELREATEAFPRYFGRAAFSRGGVELLTNTGPLAGAVSIDDCKPTPESPWLVGEFVDGPTVCTYGTFHERPARRPLHVRDPAPVAALDRDRLPLDRRHRVARADRADHGRALLHRTGVVRLHPEARGRPRR